MDSSQDQADVAPPIVLADCLDLNAAGPLATALLAARGKPATLDASGVRRLGAQCLQVLMSARATWQSDGHPWLVADASPEFTDATALMGCPDLAAPDLARPDFADATALQD